MDGTWIVRNIFICFAGWILISVSFYATKEYLKKEYPYYAEPWKTLDPKPNPLPSPKRRLFIGIHYSSVALVLALGVAFTITTVGISDEIDYIDDEIHSIDTFIVMSCLILPTIWSSIETYFNDMKELMAGAGRQAR